MRLELDSARLVYQQGTPFALEALAGVTLSIDPGERLGIVGPVGSGKSSLLAVMAGITPPDSGELTHDGRLINRRNPPLPGTVGLAFQSPENCLFARTVLEDVAFALRPLGLSEAERRCRAERALLWAGMEPARFGGRNPFSLSAGEQRRVALAGLIVSEPRALLLDEPTAYLDPAARRDIIDRLNQFNRESGATIVIVSHDLDDITRFARRLVIVNDGSIADDGEAGVMLGNAELMRRHGLEPPALTSLSDMLGLSEAFRSEEGAVEGLLAMAQGWGGGRCV